MPLTSTERDPGYRAPTVDASPPAGVDGDFWMFMIAASIVGGLLLANALVPPSGAL